MSKETRQKIQDGTWSLLLLPLLHQLQLSFSIPLLLLLMHEQMYHHNMTIVITNATEDMMKRSFKKLLLHSMRLDKAASFQAKEGEKLRIS